MKVTHLEVSYGNDMSVMSWNFGRSFLYFSSILSNTLVAIPAKVPGGTQPRSAFRAVYYQLVIKCSVETRPKKARISTLYLKWYLIISELQNAPWLRPANAHQKY